MALLYDVLASDVPHGMRCLNCDKRLLASPAASEAEAFGRPGVLFCRASNTPARYLTY